MAQAGDGGMGAAGGQLGGQANGAARLPVAGDVATAALGGQENGVVPLNMVGNAAPAAVVLAGAPVAAMLAVPAGVGMPLGFDVDSVLLGPLPTKCNFKDYEVYPLVD